MSHVTHVGVCLCIYACLCVSQRYISTHAQGYNKRHQAEAKGLKPTSCRCTKYNLKKNKDLT